MNFEELLTDISMPFIPTNNNLMYKCLVEEYLKCLETFEIRTDMTKHNLEYSTFHLTKLKKKRKKHV